MSDLICSEVHTFTHQLGEEGETGTRLARFMFSTPPSLGREWTSLSFGPSELEFTGIRRSRSIPVDVGEDSGGEDIEVPRFTSLDCRGLGDGMVEYDSDGDMDLPRNKGGEDKQLVVEHKLATGLGEVGLQVWRGSLVLADYLLENHQQFCGKNVLEVGAGTAVAAIVASICGANVLATDIENKEVLELMEKNVERNHNLLIGDVTVKALNFNTDVSKRDDLKNIEIVLAGDIIYDDDITEDFIRFMVNLHNKVSCDSLKFIVALEKRFVFTVADLDTVAPAHDFFISQLEQFGDNFKTCKISTNYINLDFPQYFCYERSKDMVLLEIVCQIKD
eukprot:GFUD01135964.1.p1 GENE.GFUD01135964.1~~GFUD01135964.1.p1  ORF type:complete len:334 (+),score=87.93 GFUD01135964.1:328-1329(+)